MSNFLGARLMLLAALVGCGGVASGQVAPKSPVHVTVNGVLFLCPQLVQHGSAPAEPELAKLGFQTSIGSGEGSLQFDAIENSRSILNVRYETADRRCILNYAGAGYEQISGVVRDTVVKNGLKRLTGGDKDGAKADVFEGRVPGRANTARVIVIENYTDRSAAISYSER
ncbi:hypothetical protein [Sphingosinicella sp. BN140058]|uniref:hypothetical protein n=1 Tax=Sphingosinicella sp. BN140058 TaxID=1892855 RepID=UPI00101140D9|nr:hypothetical protein [Sphingosinicella sp. BN140058]QAY75402.1 hypothetical protein ETR14_01815 [Sphingosinicella sp. BN140058]